MSSSIVMRLFRAVWEDVIRHISGPLGIRLRRSYYRNRLAHCGQYLTIDTGVYLTNPEYIHLGDHVWIDKNSILIAGPSKSSNIRRLGKDLLNEIEGHIYIGNNAHIGIANVIQGHGGIKTGDYFTTSAQVVIYSLSNDPRSCRKGTLPGPETHYLLTPIQIGHNVWLGLGVSMIGNQIGDDVFVKPHAVVSRPLPNNCIAAGIPAVAAQTRF